MMEKKSLVEAGLNKDIESLKEILFVKTSALGDIIHTFSSIAFLKKKYPDVLIDWVVEKPFAELVQAHPDVRHVLSVDTKKWRKQLLSREVWKEIALFRSTLRKKTYDVIFDFQGNLKSGLLVWNAKGKAKVGFASDTVPEWPNLLFNKTRFNVPSGANIRHDYLYLVQAFCHDYSSLTDSGVSLKLTTEQQNRLNQLTNDPLLLAHPFKMMVCPGSFWRNKQLPEGTLLSFLQAVHQEYHCFFLFVWGSQEEHALVCQLHERFPKSSCIIPRLPLPALQNLMRQVHLIIAMDSLPLHLAGTTDTPTFSLFGPSRADKYAPLGKQHCWIQGTCPYRKTFEKRCSLLRTCSTGACLHEMPAKEIFDSFQTWYKNR